MQDVVPPDNNHRSIRDIPVSHPHRSPAPREEMHRPPEDFDDGSDERGGRGRLFLWIVAIVVLCVVGGTLASMFFERAVITVYPRQASVALPATLTAGLDAPVGSLSYQLLTVSQTGTRTAPASGTQHVDKAAQGTITIYNDYSAAPQTLIAQTRFEAPDGKIYRIHQQVIVPGATRGSDGTLTPGSVTAVAYADQTGPSYNRGETTFTIPGFKGSARYNSFSAKASSMAGGFSGTEPAVADSDLKTAQTAMEQDIASHLPSTAQSQIPDGFIAVPGTLSIAYGDPAIGSQSGSQANIVEAATATEAIIRAGDLANAIAKQQVAGYGGEAINFADPSALQMTLASGTPFTADSSSITLVLTGTTTLIWQFDPTAVAQALAGKNKSDFQSIIKSSFSPAIAKATASLRPFWKNVFPAQADSIQIKTASGN